MVTLDNLFSGSPPNIICIDMCFILMDITDIQKKQVRNYIFVYLFIRIRFT